MSTAINLPADKFDTSMTFVTPDNAPARVPLDKLAVLPGFNTRVKDEDYQERVLGISESIVANGFFNDKPFAVVMLPGDETVYIYDGEHRFDAAKAATLDGAEFPDGLPVAWAKDGATVRDLTIHLAHGNAGERLNMVELAAVVRRMEGLGMDKAEIAEALGRTTRHVDNLFVLAGSNQTVKKAVAEGKIAGAEAVKLVRKHGSKDAATEITARIKKAAEQGKAKATPKTQKPAGPKMKKVGISANFGEGDVMGDVLKNIAKAIRAEVQIDDSNDKLTEDGKIEITLHVIDREAEAAKAAAEKAKADAAAKRAADKKAKDAAAAKKKAEDAAKREAEKKLLAQAAKGDGKKAAPKKAGGKTPAKGKTAAKPAGKAKPAAAAQKPKEADSKAKATEVAQTTENAPSGQESGAQAADDGMGGL